MGRHSYFYYTFNLVRSLFIKTYVPSNVCSTMCRWALIVNLSNLIIYPGLTTTDIDATSGQDYTGLENSTIIFSPGQVSTFETIDIIPDQKKEEDECFLVALHKISTTPDNLDFCSKNVNVFIKDDDGKVLVLLFAVYNPNKIKVLVTKSYYVLRFRHRCCCCCYWIFLLYVGAPR